ncbi:MAG: hypothetical protein QHC67_06040 [Sphingobium sp.]|uniref:hypothetical protein n=1 Tax=Sphingobium sp. TaxID=1912891 RepID=UPI0029A46309|nr:hypothetical protein [Sphingobium sp.]MDX3909364.1 hypothetical protein [Sphingobium sp.]
MKPLSISRAWEETVAFVKREGSLLFPVALLFLALPIVLFQQMVPPELMANIMKAEAGRGQAALPAVPAGFWLGFALMMIVGLVGALTVYALALRPGISVGEAMKLGLQRLPVLLGAGLLVAAAGGLAVLALAVLAAVFSLVGGAAAVTALVTMSVVIAMLFAAVRLLLMNALAIDRPVGPVDAIRQSWALTRGQFWRLLAFLAVVIFLTLIVQTAVQSVFGVIGGLVGGAELALLAGGLATAAISAVVQVYFMVMTARIYRQLEGAG